jgi:hypothetical protein
MKRTVTNGLVVVSTLLCLAFLTLYGYAWIVKPDVFQPSSRIHVVGDLGVYVTGSWGGQIAIFNYDAPYLGSMLGDAKIIGGFDNCGIYFRRIRYDIPKKDWWTLMFSLWYPIIIFGVTPITSLSRYLMRPRHLSEPVKTAANQ